MWSVVIITGGFFRAQKKIIYNAFLDNSGRFLLSLIFLGSIGLYLKEVKEGDLNAIKAHFYAVFSLFILSIILLAMVLKLNGSTTITKTKEFLKKSLPITVSTSLLIILGGIDVFVLGIFESENQIGIYNVNYRLAILSSISLQAVNSILAPKISEAFHTNDIANYNKMISFATRVNVLITVLIILGTLIFNKEILNLFGEEFAQAGSNVLFILCVGQIISSLSGSVGVILQMAFKDTIYNSILIGALTLNLVLNFILIPNLGIQGAAFATAMSTSFWNIVGTIYLKRKLGIQTYLNLKFK